MITDSINSPAQHQFWRVISGEGRRSQPRSNLSSTGPMWKLPPSNKASPSSIVHQLLWLSPSRIKRRNSNGGERRRPTTFLQLQGRRCTGDVQKIGPFQFSHLHILHSAPLETDQDLALGRRSATWGFFCVYVRTFANPDSSRFRVIYQRSWALSSRATI